MAFDTMEIYLVRSAKAEIHINYNRGTIVFLFFFFFYLFHHHHLLLPLPILYFFSDFKYGLMTGTMWYQMCDHFKCCLSFSKQLS